MLMQSTPDPYQTLLVKIHSEYNSLLFVVSSIFAPYKKGGPLLISIPLKDRFYLTLLGLESMKQFKVATMYMSLSNNPFYLPWQQICSGSM